MPWRNGKEICRRNGQMNNEVMGALRKLIRQELKEVSMNDFFTDSGKKGHRNFQKDS